MDEHGHLGIDEAHRAIERSPCRRVESRFRGIGHCADDRAAPRRPARPAATGGHAARRRRGSGARISSETSTPSKSSASRTVSMADQSSFRRPSPRRCRWRRRDDRPRRRGIALARRAHHLRFLVEAEHAEPVEPTLEQAVLDLLHGEPDEAGSACTGRTEAWPDMSSTPARSPRGSKIGAAAQGRIRCGSKKCSAPCTPIGRRSTRAVPIALVPMRGLVRGRRPAGAPPARRGGEFRVAGHLQHQAVAIGQDHHAVGELRLLAQRHHLRPRGCGGAVRAVPVLRGAPPMLIGSTCGRSPASSPAQRAALPRAQDRRRDQARRATRLRERNVFARPRQYPPLLLTPSPCLPTVAGCNTCRPASVPPRKLLHHSPRNVHPKQRCGRRYLPAVICINDLPLRSMAVAAFGRAAGHGRCKSTGVFTMEETMNKPEFLGTQDSRPLQAALREFHRRPVGRAGRGPISTTAPADHRRQDHRDPPLAEGGYRTRPRCRPCRERSPGADTAPPIAPRILNQIADRMEAESDLARRRPRPSDNGKPIRETMDADLPLAVDHFRYFAGCHPRAGRRAVRARPRHRRLSLPRAARRRRPDHPLELPDPDGGVEARPGARRRQLRRAEAGRADAGLDHGSLMDLIGDLLPPGVLNVVNGFGVEAGKPLASEQAHRQDRLHRRDDHRPAHHAVRHPRT